MSKIKVGIIGGTGLDDPDIVQDRKEKAVETPYGKPSDVLITGTIGGVDCILLARHGRGHTIRPSDVNYRANVCALKEEGCTHVVVTTACGSLQENIRPGQIVILDQFIDRTTKREQSFYDGSPTSPKGICHIPMHTPFCEKTRQVLIESVKQLGYNYHPTGTVVTIEGPRFSSRAESKLFRSWGGHVINMTTVPEVVLAAEMGLCYGAVALPTDYDSWRDEGNEHVSVEVVMKTFKQNAEKGKKILLEAIPRLANYDWASVIEERVVTAKESVMV
ncbi:S-methyl-5'-thioadenosine phosphorylase-like [Acanthaster planci]|uniref:S-methyl-5'-thioadenosine phosphorylase n=1 Tax=Acanthaster planci TaxID=133434 RepID=A0A8B7ZAI9_ACAPL|nr:S-methyl-5'-thioadenosine phosphorylase-like [Acanthaster planci]